MECYNFVVETIITYYCFIAGRKTSSVDSFSSSSLEIVAPSTSDVEFKYSWPIDGFIQQVRLKTGDGNGDNDDAQVKTCKADGLDSKNFEINVNGVLTIWNLSVRYWHADHQNDNHHVGDQVLDG